MSHQDRVDLLSSAEAFSRAIEAAHRANLDEMTRSAHSVTQATLPFILPTSPLASLRISPDYFTSEDRDVFSQLFQTWALDKQMCLFELLYLDIGNRIAELYKHTDRYAAASQFNKLATEWSQSFLVAYAGYCAHIRNPIAPTDVRNNYSFAPGRFIDFMGSIQQTLSLTRLQIENELSASPSTGRSSRRSKIEALKRQQNEEMQKAIQAATHDINVRFGLFQKLLELQPKVSESFLSGENVFAVYRGSENLTKGDFQQTLNHLCVYLDMIAKSLDPNDFTGRILGIRFDRTNPFKHISRMLNRIAEIVAKLEECHDERERQHFSEELQELIRQFSYETQIKILQHSNIAYTAVRNLERIVESGMTHEQYCQKMGVTPSKVKTQEEFFATLESQNLQSNLLCQCLYDVHRVFDDALHLYDPHYMTNEKLYYQLLSLISSFSAENNLSVLVAMFTAELSSAESNLTEEERIALSEFLLPRLHGMFERYKRMYAERPCFEDIVKVGLAAIEQRNPLLFRLNDWLETFTEMDHLWKANQRPGPENLHDLLAIDLERLALEFQEECTVHQLEITDRLHKKVKEVCISLVSPLSRINLMLRIVHEIFSQEKTLMGDYDDSDFISERLQQALRFATLAPDRASSPSSVELSDEIEPVLEGADHVKVSDGKREKQAPELLEEMPTLQMGGNSSKERLPEQAAVMQPSQAELEVLSPTPAKTQKRKKKKRGKQKASSVHLLAPAPRQPHIVTKRRRLFERSEKGRKRRNIIKNLIDAGFRKDPNGGDSTHERFSFRDHSIFIPLGHGGTIPVGTVGAIETQALTALGDSDAK